MPSEGQIARSRAAEARREQRSGGRMMPAEHAILGLLALDEQEATTSGAGGGGGYGYDLARRFAVGEPLGAVLRLAPGMLYHHLKKLAGRGWVEADVENQGARPPRHRHRLTAAGRQELTRWLRQPVSHPRELRLEFLLKLYFAQKFDPELAALLLAEQRATLDRLQASLTAQSRELNSPVAASAAAAHDHQFRRLVIDLRLAQTGAAAAWLEHVIAASSGSAAGNEGFDAPPPGDPAAGAR